MVVPRAVKLMAAMAVLLLVWARSARADEPADDAASDNGIEVDVFGARLRKSDDATTAATHFDREDLSWPGLSTADVLSTAPSVSVARTGGSSDLATATLRGATSAETPVYLGPILLNDDLTGTADLSTVPPSLLGSIDVYRGHAPIELERSGLGGAIVLRPFVASGSHAAVGAAAGSFGERSVNAHGSVGRAGSAAMVAVNLFQTKGNFAYLDDRGTRFDVSDDREVDRQNGDARAVDVWSAAHLELGKGSVDALFRSFAREQGVPGLGVLPARRARAKTHGFLGALSARAACNAGCFVDVAAWGRASRYTLSDPDRELLLASERQRTSAMSTGARLGVVLSPAPWLEVKSGAAFGLGAVAVDPLGASQTRARRSNVRAYAALLAKPVDWLEARLEGSIASDYVTAKSGALSQQTPAGRVGVAVHPVAGLSVFATGARYGRVPTLGEQFGVGATVLGNDQLRPESGLALDLGTRGELAPHDEVDLALELTGFLRSATDRIAYERSSFGALRPFNLDSARVLGFEATAAALFFRVLEAGGSLTLTDARDTSESRTTVNDLLPFEARLVATPSLALRLRDLVAQIHWDKAVLRSILIYRAPRTADPAGLIELPSQVLLDVEGSFGFDDGKVELAWRLSNLIGNQTTDLVGYPLPGRAGHISVSSRWP